MDKQIHSVVLGVLALCFIGGIAAGCLCSAWGGESADSAVAGYLTDITRNEFQAPEMAKAFLNQFQYPIACFLLGMTLLGVFFIPACLAARGFFLAFTVTSCMRVFGLGPGLLLAGSMLALPALISVPCMFLLGTFGGAASLSLLVNTASRGKRPAALPVFSKIAFVRLGLCLLAMTAAALMEIFVCPPLIQAALPYVLAG